MIVVRAVRISICSHATGAGDGSHRRVPVDVRSPRARTSTDEIGKRAYVLIANEQYNNTPVGKV